MEEPMPWIGVYMYDIFWKVDFLQNLQKHKKMSFTSPN